MSDPNQRYDLLEKLGEGGAGSVYKAWDKRLQRYVAIKRLHPADQREGEGVGTNLVKEAAALSSLQHPNIVSVYDLDAIDGEPCVVMEFLNGETLEQTMRRGALNLVDFAAVARQSLEGLVAAHRLGVQHRDLKPSNFMVNWLPNGDFLVKMLDFGLADFSSRPHQQVAEGEGETYGSVHFMAPEQFLRHPVDVRTDIYSLGCVLYYSLTAKYPFDGRSMEEIINGHLRTIPTPIHELRGDVSTGLSEWVAWLMSRDTQHRPQSAEEALGMFLDVQSGKVKTLGKSRMLKTQQVVKPVTTSVRPGPVSAPTGRTGPVRPAPAPRQPAPVTTPSTLAPASSASKAKPKPKLTTGVIAAIVGGGLALVGVIIYLMRPSQPPETPVVNLGPPPVADPFLWARADVGVKKSKGTMAAKYGDTIDYWQDQAPLDGPNSIDYFNTRSKEAERVVRLPEYREWNLNGGSYPVLHFNGSNCMLLSTPDAKGKEMADPTLIHGSPEITYCIICRVEAHPEKMVLLGCGAARQKALWELYVEKKSICIGSKGKVGAVPIPAGAQFMGIVLSVSIPKKEGQIFVSFGKGEPVSSPLVKDLQVDPKVERVRLGSVAFTMTTTKEYFRGDIAEVLGYSRKLSDTDRKAFNDYFTKKYLP